MAKLLIEILTEEIPYTLQIQLKLDMAQLWQEILKKYNLQAPLKEDVNITNLSLNTNKENITVLATPRRLTILFEDLPSKSEDQVEEKKGPKVDAPLSILESFLKSNKLKLEDCIKKTTAKGEFYFFNLVKKGGDLKDILPSLIMETLTQVKMKKSMRWHSTNFTWARPIRNILIILDNENLKVDFNNLIPWMVSTNFTKGHRFMGQEIISIGSVDDYFIKLKENFVILDPKERREMILKSANIIAEKAGAKLHENPNLLNELTYLVEYPVLLEGEIPQKYMILPPEMLINILVKNQRYLILINYDGSINNKFIIVSNLKTKDNGTQIIKGNQKVLQARLEDGLFFYNNDLQNKLQSKIEDLKKITYFERLGTIYDKVQRVKILFYTIFASEQNLLCDLYKADITTQVVIELPELQGIMGYYYALQQKEDLDLALAIRDQYKPQGNTDSLPENLLGAQLAIVDKLDTLISFFGIGQKPTGSKDPFALRRACLGIIRIILEFRLNLNLNQYLSTELIQFFRERLIVYIQGDYDNLALVKSIVNKQDLNIVKIQQDLKTTSHLLAQEEGLQVITLYKRVNNILKPHKSYLENFKKENPNALEFSHIKSSLLVKPQEKALYDAITQLLIMNLTFDNKLDLLLKEFFKIKPLVDDFLDNVLINETEQPTLKVNRLALLYNLLDLLHMYIPE
ncbi:Glycine--tRNA ligase beta subunit [Candidatus Hepatincolaceae symbiont of Richtersius coronifer]